MQKRNEYAVGEVIENGVGYTVTVGKPYADGTATAETGDESVEAIIPYLPGAVVDADLGLNDYLLTLEINGELIAYRELHSYTDTADGYMLVNRNVDDVACPIGVNFVDAGWYIWNTDADNAAIAEDDEVRLLIEPVNIKLSPAFRAAVKKAYVAKEPEPVEGIEPIDVNPGDINIKPLG